MAKNVKKIYKKIIREASHLDQDLYGYGHRRHKKNKEKSGKARTLNFKKQKINELKELEWSEYINIIRNEY
jgi:hypothetical protein